MTFEEKAIYLETLIAKMETGTLDLNESMELHQKSQVLIKELKQELDESMKKMSYMVQDGNVVPLETIESEEKDI